MRPFRDGFNNSILRTAGAAWFFIMIDAIKHVCTQLANLTGVLMMVLIHAKTHKQPCPRRSVVNPEGKIKRGRNEF